MVTTIQGTTSWTMNASDGPITGYLRVSGGATSFVASTIIGTLGTLDITQTGTYTYTPNRAAFQSLAGGEIVTDQFTISATDGTREVITFDVLGHPDAPTFSGSSGGTVFEDGAPLSARVIVTDPDYGESGVRAKMNVRTDGGFGTFSIATSGNYTYTLDNGNTAVNALSDGDILRDSITVESLDGTALTLTFIISGRTDPPLLTLSPAPPTPSPAPPAPAAPPASTLNGGTSIDYAIMTGQHAAFSAEGSPSSWSSVTFKGAADSHGTMTGIERIRFDDGLYAYDIDGHAGLVYRLYAVAFDRAPDERGIGHWVRALDGGMKAKDLAAIFLASSEFKGAKLSNAAFAEKLLTNLLDRAPTADEKASLIARLNKGEGRAELLLSLAESATAKAATADAVKDGIKLSLEDITVMPAAGDDSAGGRPEHIEGSGGLDYAVLEGKSSDYTLTLNAPGVITASGRGKTFILDEIERIRFTDEVRAFDDAAAMLYRLYEAAFDRAPDARGFSHMLNLIDQGMSARNAAAAMLASEEGRSAAPATLAARDFIAGLYSHLLNREASAGEIGAWTKWLSAHNNDRAALLVGIADSQEARATTDEALKHGLSVV